MYAVLHIYLYVCIRVIYVVLQPNHQKTEKDIHFYDSTFTQFCTKFAESFGFH